MNKTTEALKLAEEALNAMLTHMGMDEDEWTKPTFNQAREALAAIREALADHSGDANEMVMDWSKVKPEAINSDPMYQMGYAAAKAEPVKQEPVFIPEFPEIFSLADIGYAQHEKPDGWDDGHFKTWQDLQVCTRNKMLWYKYAKELRNLLINSQPVNQKAVGCYYGTADHIGHVVRIDVEIPIGTLLYAAPVSAKREWVDLTPIELAEAFVDKGSADAGIRAVIAAFKEKNSV